MDIFSIFDDILTGTGSIASVIGSLFASVFGSLTGFAVFAVTALAVMRMSGSLGMRKTWLAWIPGAQEYRLGQLADEYTARAGGRSTRYRIVLPVMMGVRTVFAFVIFGCMALSVGTLIAATVSGIMGSDIAGGELTEAAVIALFVGVFFLLLLILTFIPRWIALNYIYRMFDPDRAGGYTLLNVLFAVSVPFTLLAASHHKPVGPQAAFTEYV